MSENDLLSKIRHIKNKMLGRMLSINDLCEDEQQRRIMRQAILANGNLAFRDIEDAIDNNTPNA